MAVQALTVDTLVTCGTLGVGVFGLIVTVTPTVKTLTINTFAVGGALRVGVGMVRITVAPTGQLITTRFGQLGWRIGHAYLQNYSNTIKNNKLHGVGQRPCNFFTKEKTHAQRPT